MRTIFNTFVNGAEMYRIQYETPTCEDTPKFFIPNDDGCLSEVSREEFIEDLRNNTTVSIYEQEKLLDMASWRSLNELKDQERLVIDLIKENPNFEDHIHKMLYQRRLRTAEEQIEKLFNGKFDGFKIEYDKHMFHIIVKDYIGFLNSIDTQWLSPEEKELFDKTKDCRKEYEETEDKGVIGPLTDYTDLLIGNIEDSLNSYVDISFEEITNYACNCVNTGEWEYFQYNDKQQVREKVADYVYYS